MRKLFDLSFLMAILVFSMACRASEGDEKVVGEETIDEKTEIMRLAIQEVHLDQAIKALNRIFCIKPDGLYQDEECKKLEEDAAKESLQLLADKVEEIKKQRQVLVEAYVWAGSYLKEELENLREKASIELDHRQSGISVESLEGNAFCDRHKANTQYISAMKSVLSELDRCEKMKPIKDILNIIMRNQYKDIAVDGSEIQVEDKAEAEQE